MCMFVCVACNRGGDATPATVWLATQQECHPQHKGGTATQHATHANTHNQHGATALAVVTACWVLQTF